MEATKAAKSGNHCTYIGHSAAFSKTSSIEHTLDEFFEANDAYKQFLEHDLHYH
jgi:hypothetical protein